jgi:sugar/nucleoside kinase (ribokinase family)
MDTKRNGLLAAGNWILDQVKVIDKYPSEQSLCNILDEYASNGGSAYNILVDLVKLGAAFPLEAAGLVGLDVNGQTILRHCADLGIDTGQLTQAPDAPTSYTLVTSVASTGKRTFFHHRGANAHFDSAHLSLEKSSAKIFHLGYLLLLDRLDVMEEDGTTGAARLLRSAKDQGFYTSVDLVSEDGDRFATVIPPALPYVDVLLLNEFEASKLSGLDLCGEDVLPRMEEACEGVFERIFAMGVREWIIIHRPEGVWAAHANGQRVFQASLRVPSDFIKGANGAGDALAAGVLFGLHEGWAMPACLELGVCAAASSLSHVTCSDGIQDVESCLEFREKFGLNQ